MQVKKFEAPTIQEALDNIKRELGPEAIILQTKKYKRGFGLMSRASVEVTAAVSERSMQKKGYVDKRLADRDKDAFGKMPASKQAEYLEKHGDRHLQNLEERARGRDQVELSSARARAQTQALVQAQTPLSRSRQAAAPAAAPARKITSTRYIDIDSEPAALSAQSSTRASAQSSPAAGARPGSVGVEDDVRHLKRMIEELKSAQENTSSEATPRGSLFTPALQDAFEQLVLNGVERRLALALLRKVGFELGEERSASPDEVLDQLAGEIMSGVSRESGLPSPILRLEPKSQTGAAAAPAVIALVGPTGVGKTTTVAKLASEAILKRGLKVGLINLDSYKVAAFDQLGTYAKILNVPFRSVATRDELLAAMRDFQGLDLVLVDTTGRSQKDPGSLTEMKDLLEAIPSHSSLLVLAATTRDTELYDMASRFGTFRPQGLIVSKLDEASIFGSIYNLAQKVKLPLEYFTTGQRVPEDIEEATGERVAALLLEL